MTGIGKIRRSQVIGTYGPGAIIDFRSPEGAPISAVSGGLELWEEAKLDHRQRIHEVRLQASLKVDFFHQPPVGKYKTAAKDAKGYAIEEDRELPAVRFPEWCFCPSCDRLKHIRDWVSDPAKPDRWCPVCSGQKGKPKRQFVVPVRLVVACEAGHLDEFPWDRWVGHVEGCKRRDLKLVGEAAGLAGLVVKCDGCGAEKSLAKAYGPHALERIGHSCTGRRPWLPLAHREACGHAAAVIQRGASNAWFPIVESAIDIPPFSDEFTQFIRQEQYWKAFKALGDPAHIRGVIEDNELMEEWHGPPMTLREMEAQIRRIFDRDQQGPETDLRAEEYARLVAPPTQGVTDRNFKIEVEAIPDGLAGFVGHLVRVERLREVRVLTGFTRLTALGQEKQAREPASLSASKKKNWLPAVEVFGEGIFVTLDLVRLREWEQRPPVCARIAALNAQLEQAAKARGGTPVAPWPLTARRVLIHTLCHAVIDRLSLDCGYSSSSVRERLYSGPEGSDMAGLKAAAAPAMPKLKPVPDNALSAVGETLRDEGLPAPVSGGGTTFLQARTANEVLKAQERKLKLAQLKGELIDRNRAVALVFRLAREERDAWVTWPARAAALMASELGVMIADHGVLEPAMMQKVLEAHVRAQLESLAEVRIDLR